MSIDEIEKAGRLASIKTAANELVERAKQYGVVLTIEQVPLSPRMGHYETLVSVRPVRDAA